MRIERWGNLIEIFESEILIDRDQSQTIDKETYFMSTDTLNLDLESGRIDIEIESLDREFVYFL